MPPKKASGHAGRVKKSTPSDIPPPPYDGGVDAALEWAARLQARSATLARQGQDELRGRAVITVVAAMGKLRTFASDSEKAAQILAERRRIQIDLHGKEAPAEAVGLCAWAFWQLADLLHEVLTAARPMTGVLYQTKALVTIGHVRPQAAIDQLLAELEAAQAKD